MLAPKPDGGGRARGGKAAELREFGFLHFVKAYAAVFHAPDAAPSGGGGGGGGAHVRLGWLMTQVWRMMSCM